MNIEATSLPDVLVLKPRRFSDARGYFMETFREDIFRKETATTVHFMQENQSLSTQADTIRGLHYQSPPYAQGKLVRCIQGAILDVAVDIRKGSPHYGQSIAVELTAENDQQLWVPAGFLHGFRTLKDDTIVSYKCTSTYAPNYDGAVLWNDAALNIDWGILEPSIMSDKDQTATPFSEFQTPFKYKPAS